ncbi:MAG: tetratricopeptide repeat protein [Gammaproteobacteria bacterium]|nr:tetratricopeptide repeat protein [Gammaproteobacteria bacterium]
MDDRLYQFLKVTAIAMTLVWLGWAVFDNFFRDQEPGEHAYHAANKLFNDGHYERALQAYDEALQNQPDDIHALRGRARSLMQLGRSEDALSAFNQAIRWQPEFAGTYANRGILYDRMGRYQKAIADYERAVQLDSEVAEGPHWLTRFLRLQPEKPPTVADRARYLRAELAKPESERILQQPELDSAQRSYKQ